LDVHLRVLRILFSYQVPSPAVSLQPCPQPRGAAGQPRDRGHLGRESRRRRCRQRFCCPLRCCPPNPRSRGAAPRGTGWRGLAAGLLAPDLSRAVRREHRFPWL